MSAEHLVVLVHGLWGNASHMWYIKKALTDEYPDISVLVCETNAGNRTYDGIDVCGERVAKEVREKVGRMAKDGDRCTKISFVGYSFGGLASRYAIGVLYSTDFFTDIEPICFTTFATPHLGVSPTSTGVFSWLVSSLGPRTLSVTGAHIFLADSLVKSRPLLEVMSDEESRFFKGLERFQKRAAYANIVHDRSVPYFTAAITDEDPYQDLSKIKLNHDSSYGNTLLDSTEPHTVVTGTDEKVQPVVVPPLTYKELLFRTVMVAGAPLWLAVFSANAVVATYQSSQRISQHRDENPADDDETDLSATMTQDAVEEIMDNSTEQPSTDAFGKLKLNKYQSKIVSNLNKLKWEKYCVHIQKTQHSHAAIVCRTKDSDRLTEGHDVMAHWLGHVLVA